MLEAWGVLFDVALNRISPKKSSHTLLCQLHAWAKRSVARLGSHTRFKASKYVVRSWRSFKRYTRSARHVRNFWHRFGGDGSRPMMHQGQRKHSKRAVPSIVSWRCVDCCASRFIRSCGSPPTTSSNDLQIGSVVFEGFSRKTPHRASKE